MWLTFNPLFSTRWRALLAALLGGKSKEIQSDCLSFFKDLNPERLQI